MQDEKYYVISESMLAELISAEARLNSLEGGGVDNWEWYGESLKDGFEAYQEDLTEALIGYNPNDCDNWYDLALMEIEYLIDKNRIKIAKDEGMLKVLRTILNEMENAIDEYLLQN